LPPVKSMAWGDLTKRSPPRTFQAWQQNPVESEPPE
jgi:hypothetical protein